MDEIERAEPEGLVFEAYLNTMNAALSRGDIDTTAAMENLAAFYNVVTDVLEWQQAQAVVEAESVLASL